MKSLVDFLNSQKILVLATHTQDPTPHPWVSNVYYVIDEMPHLYFFGSPEVKWSQDLKQNPNVAFSVAWSHSEDMHDRKGVQGVGEALLADHDHYIPTAVSMYHQKFPQSVDKINEEIIKQGKSELYIIKPKYIKFWDDSNQEGKISEFEF